MMKLKSEWQTEELATAFLEGVRGAIPGADLQMAVLGSITRRWCDAPSTVLDLGCGDGILGRFLLETFPASQGVFVDFSDPMLDAVHEKVEAMPHTSVVKADFSTSEWLNAVSPFALFDVVVSGFAIHHQPNDRKKELYAEIFDLLLPDGVFLNLEHVASRTPAGERLFDEFFVDHLHAAHATSDAKTSREHVADTYYNRPDKKENILAPVEEQCDWLRTVGFRDVDCFFKVFELALFGGRKPSSDRVQRISVSDTAQLDH